MDATYHRRPWSALRPLRSARSWTRGSVALDLHDLRVAGALMLAAAIVLPLLPGTPGLACPLRTLTGVPCPLCGMTTSVEAIVRLDLGGALRTNPAGLAIVAGAIVLLVRPPSRLTLHRAVLSGALVTMWVFELHRYGLI